MIYYDPQIQSKNHASNSEKTAGAPNWHTLEGNRVNQYRTLNVSH